MSYSFRPAGADIFIHTLNSRFAKLCACPTDITSETFITFIQFRSLSAEFISCRRMTVFILAIFPLQSLITPYKSRKNQEEFAAPTGHLLSSPFNNEYLLTRSDFFSQTIKQVQLNKMGKNKQKNFFLKPNSIRYDTKFFLIKF